MDKNTKKANDKDQVQNDEQTSTIWFCARKKYCHLIRNLILMSQCDDLMGHTDCEGLIKGDDEDSTRYLP